jgi:hypothetical protein
LINIALGSVQKLKDGVSHDKILITGDVLKYVESSKVVAGSGSAVMKFSKFEISWCGVKSSGVSDMKNFALTAQLAVMLLHHRIAVTVIVTITVIVSVTIRVTVTIRDTITVRIQSQSQCQSHSQR